MVFIKKFKLSNLLLLLFPKKNFFFYELNYKSNINYYNIIEHRLRSYLNWNFYWLLLFRIDLFYNNTYFYLNYTIFSVLKSGNIVIVNHWNYFLDYYPNIIRILGTYRWKSVSLFYKNEINQAEKIFNLMSENIISRNEDFNDSLLFNYNTYLDIEKDFYNKYTEYQYQTGYTVHENFLKRDHVLWLFPYRYFYTYRLLWPILAKKSRARFIPFNLPTEKLYRYTPMDLLKNLYYYEHETSLLKKKDFNFVLKEFNNEKRNKKNIFQLKDEHLKLFWGLCIKKGKKGISSYFILRNLFMNVVIEYNFKIFSPNLGVFSILKYKKRGNYKRSKLYFYRNLKNIKSRITYSIFKKKKFNKNA